MKIEQNLFMNIFSASSRKDGQIKLTDVTAETQQANEIKMSIREEAKELSILVEKLNNTENVRENRIQAIREQMEAGTYHITGAEVISRLSGGY